MNTNHNILVSTIGGTLLSITPQLLGVSQLGNDFLKTAFLAAFGALVSFTASVLLRYLLRKFRK